MTNRSTTVTAGPRTRRWGAAGVVCLVFLLAHVPFLAPTLEDIDSANFALGVQDFDPAMHRPHPPGYPIYIALAKLSTAAFNWVHPSGTAGVHAAEPSRREAGDSPVRAQNGALGLSFWSVVFGALAAFSLLRLFERLDGDGPRVAPLALVLAVACPLFWFTAVRPLSDVPGLVAALAGQALLVGAALTLWHAPRPASGTSPSSASLDLSVPAADRLAVAGIFVSALAIGLRSQAMWLTLPLVALVMAYRFGRPKPVGAFCASLGALISGTLLWAVPLVFFTGGISRYLGALAQQGGEDFSGVDMFWTNRTPRRFVFGLIDTLVVPWGSTLLAAAVVLLATLGVLVLLRRRPVVLALIAVGFLPYAAFHLLFHETVTTRYALPLVPPVAYLAMCGASVLARRFQVVVAGALVIASLVVVVPPVVRYGRDGSPVSRMLDDMRAHRRSEMGNIVLSMHRRVQTETRRAFQWELGGTTLWSRTLPSPARHEWLELVKYWTEGGEDPVWFLGEPLRTDLALVDPASRRLMTAYRWPFPTGPFVGGIRPGDVDWYEIGSPGWFLGEGWGLTPETAGVAQVYGKGPDRGPIAAWVRRRPGGATLLVGGRNLGGPSAPAARIDIGLDGRTVSSTVVKPAPGFFLNLLALPAGSLAGEGRYARLTITATANDASSQGVRAAIEQFDLQDETRVVFGYDQGWHELEYNPATGRLWRWSSASADVRVHTGGRDLTLRVTGECSQKDFSRPSQVTIRAGSVTLGRQQVSGGFSVEIAVPSAALESAGGIMTLETDQTFVPDDRTHNGDKRRLGLRVYGLSLRPQRDAGAR